MSLLQMLQTGDETASKLLDEYNNALNDAAAMDFAGQKVEFFDAQVGYRLKGVDNTLFREPVIKQIPATAVAVLDKIAMFVRCSYAAVSIEGLTSGNIRTRSINVQADDILYIEVRSEPHEPEQTDEDKRRRNLRGHSGGGGRVAKNPGSAIGYASGDQRPETD